MSVVNITEKAMKFKDHIAKIEDIIADIAAGKPVILMDDEDRENEGDIVIAAEHATPEMINFMARFARGLICLAITGERAEKLSLPPMAMRNRSRLHTNFTVSIEAREGITTGISAFDRSHTIMTAIDSGKGMEAIVSPGHVFPLVARDGGVLVRTGHTEAAVDLARLAGKTPAGVICEIMKDDGTMARLPDLIPFAKEHGLKIGTIADLIAYRRRNDLLMKCVKTFPIETSFAGQFTARLYVNDLDHTEHVALIKGDINPEQPVLVRVHSSNFFNDLLGMIPERYGNLEKALMKIDDAGSGVCVVIRDARPKALEERVSGFEDGGVTSMPPSALREYGTGAAILSDLGIKQMILMTSSGTKNPIALDGYGLEIASYTDL